MARAVPLQVETLPPLLEEGVETGVVVSFSSLDERLRAQSERFVANLPPVRFEPSQLGKGFDRHVRGSGRAGEGIHEDVDRRHESGMIEQLAPEPEPHPPPKWTMATEHRKMETTAHFMA
jgi:hypothetical protein